MKETIPVLSSCLSGALMIIASLLSGILISLLDYRSDIKDMISKGFLILVMSVHIPLILWITVKNQMKNKKPVAPARTLQFHGVIAIPSIFLKLWNIIFWNHFRIHWRIQRKHQRSFQKSFVTITLTTFPCVKFIFSFPL